MLTRQKEKGSVMTRANRWVLLGLALVLLGFGGCRPPNDHSERARSRWTFSRSAPPKPGVKEKTSKEDDKDDKESKEKKESKKEKDSRTSASKGDSEKKSVVSPRGMPPSDGRIRELVRSALPSPSEAKADEDAIEQAQKRVVERLRSLDPPIRQTPPLSLVRDQYVVKESRVVRPPNAQEQEILDQAGLSDSRNVFVEYVVEITPAQLRQLRMQDRLVDALRVVGSVFVVALAGFLFLRADEYSRGYLTSWLGLLAIVGVVTGLIVVFLVG